VKQTLQFSGGEPVDKTFTVIAGRLGQSDATACSLYIIRTA